MKSTQIMSVMTLCLSWSGCVTREVDDGRGSAQLASGRLVQLQQCGEAYQCVALCYEAEMQRYSSPDAANVGNETSEDAGPSLEYPRVLHPALTASLQQCMSECAATHPDCPTMACAPASEPQESEYVAPDAAPFEEPASLLP